LLSIVSLPSKANPSFFEEEEERNKRVVLKRKKLRKEKERGLMAIV
jgi:hypothetical protein